MNMKPFLLSFVLLLNGLTASFAQDIERMVDSAFNHLYDDTTFLNNRTRYDSTREQATFTYNFLYDSVQNRIVSDYIRKELLPAGVLTWPYYALKSGQNLSPTYRYLLSSVYHISGPPSHGCIIPYYRNRYDTIMADAIREKYGAGFFERSYKEAQLLDSCGNGLILPHSNIKGSYASFLQRELPYMDTLRSRISQDTVRYILLYFEKGKLLNAGLGMVSWGGIQTDLTLSEYEVPLTEALLKLKWVAPRFKHKPVNKMVILDLAKDKFEFSYSW